MLKETEQLTETCNFVTNIKYYLMNFVVRQTEKNLTVDLYFIFTSVNNLGLQNHYKRFIAN